jgi:uncharacterized Zn finger protein (UPF0148 family)
MGGENMFCPNCGKENEDGSLFCEACGGKILEEQQVVENKRTSAEDKASEISSYYNNTSSNNVKVAVVKKPLSLKKKIGIIAGVVIVALVVTFYVIGNKLSNPEKVAEEYMQCQVDKDWDKMYDYLSIEESDFINRDLFLKSKAQESDEEEISSFTVVGDSGKDNSSDDLEKSILVKYKSKNGSNSDGDILKLVKQEEKFLLFFDKWKVSSENILDEDYKFGVPIGTTAYLDGIEITDKYKDETNKDNYYDKYKISEVFSGGHTIKLTSPIYEDYEEYKSEGDFSFLERQDLKLKQESKDATTEIAENFLQTYYDSAIALKKFDEITSYFSSDENVLKNEKSSYGSLLKEVKPDEKSDIGLKKVTISNVSVEADKGTIYTGEVEVTVNYDYEYSGTRKQYFSDEVVDFSSDGVKSGTTHIYFTYEEGKWVIKDMNSLTLYY